MNNSEEFTSNCILARDIYSKGDYEKAQPHYKAILAQTRPQDEHALPIYYEYILCLYRLGECAEAFPLIELCLSHYPDCRELFYLKGKICYEMGLLNNSRVCLLKYISIQTSFLIKTDKVDENYKAYGVLSVIAAREGRNEEALSFLKLFIKENNNLSNLKSICLALLRSGINKQVLTESLSLNSAIDHFNLVDLLFSIEAYEEVKLLTKERFPQEAKQVEDFYNLGVSCARLGLYEQAAEYFLRAVAFDSANLVYPCLVYEALTIHAIEILTSKANSLLKNPVLENELLRLCSLKLRSRRLRRVITRQENSEEKTCSAYDQFGDYSLLGDIGEEEAWYINA